MPCPSARFQSANEMRQAVRDAWTGLTGSPLAALAWTSPLTGEETSEPLPEADHADAPQVTGADPLPASFPSCRVAAPVDGPPKEDVDSLPKPPRTRPSVPLLAASFVLAAAAAVGVAGLRSATERANERAPSPIVAEGAGLPSSAARLIPPPAEILPVTLLAPAPAVSTPDPAARRSTAAGRSSLSLPSAPVRQGPPAAAMPRDADILRRRY
jgi:hypothetical protein